MAEPVLLSCERVSKQFGARPLFSGLTFGLAAGDRVGLVGPNGAGKTTLLRILAGLEEADSGSRSVRKGVRVGFVAQDPELDLDRSAEEVVVAGLAGLPLEEFERHTRALQVLGRLGFSDPGQRASALSGGWRKRLAIARALAAEPDVLLMDEPTNHLDLEGILLLERLLGSATRAFVVASHDRWFLENVARRMLELDRVYAEGLLQVEGTYSDLLARRDEVRRNQSDYEESLANRARRELEWLRRGPKARTTKAKARVDEAERLQGELAEVRSRRVEASAGIDFASSGRKTKRLLEARGLVKAFDGRKVLDGVDLLLRPGVRLGVVGANGSGKSTLLALLAGALEPDGGVIERAPGLRIERFEQGRDSLDRELTLRRALAPEGDSVVVADRAVHVASWAKRFLFRSEQLDTSVSKLSGGEQARILIARLMLRPCDLLILDEPTNDLDIPTLEVLEESLLEFAGALVLVTHDRYLLDRVATAVLGLDGRGGATLYADRVQWEEARGRAATATGAALASASPKGETADRTAQPAQTKKLSYQEQREWERMEGEILAAEAAAAELRSTVERAATRADAPELRRSAAALEAAQGKVEQLYARWAELEARRG